MPIKELQEQYAFLLTPHHATKRNLWSAATPDEKQNLTSQVVDLILNHAVWDRASDIHIEPMEKKLRIRFRIDGQIFDVLTINDDDNIAVIQRIKVMANLPTDAMMKRKSQDGRFRFEMGKNHFDFRISTFPTVQGEKIAMRIFIDSAALYKLDRIGLDQYDLARVIQLLKHKNGLVLVSGTTGCGKTTTLYAMLNELNNHHLNIITLEDPVEYQINGMNQCDIKTKSDFGFSEGLKAVLRQDPDIILVGEMRDYETAEIALRASITGHLVLSTLHANSAVGTVTRLINMGLKPYMVSYSLVGAITQTLVRKICDSCKTSYTVGPEQLKRYGINPNLFMSNAELQPAEETYEIKYGIVEEAAGLSGVTLYKGAGCDQCNQTGYCGRVGIFEIVTFGEKLRSAILRNASSRELQEIAVGCGTKPLTLDGLEKAKKGITTIDEIASILTEWNE